MVGPRTSHRRRGFAPSEALARLRRRTTKEESFAVFRLALQLPEGAVGSAVSRAHPEVRFDIINRMELGTELVLYEIRVHARGAGGFLDEVRRFASVVDVEVHMDAPDVATYRLTQRMPVVLQVIQHHRVLARYPMTIQNGWLRFETVARPAQVRALLREMSRRVGPNRVEAVRRGTMVGQNLGLTPSQHALFRVALSEGYFGAPRAITVSELAKKLARSKSGTSEMLSKIQRRLAENAVQVDLASMVPAT
jgi:predicted DNA binding protein